jgi:hypothetical protein
MVKYTHISFIVFAVLLASCKKNNPESSTYESLNSFSEIEVNSNFDVYLVEDSIFSIEIKGFKKAISNVDYIIESGILKIDNNQKYKFTHPKTNKITLYIHSEPLETVTVNETCFIRTVNPITSEDFGLILKSKANYAELDLAGNTFYCWNNFPCGGKLTLHGTTNLLKLWNTAILSVDAKDLVASYALVQNSSKGLCEVNVTNKLEYSLLGDGNIELYGNPPIQNQIEKSGTGKLIIH